MTISTSFQTSLFYRGTLHRKRRRLEDYQESQTVNTMADMIGRGKISVEGAAGLARSICKDHDIPHEALTAFASLGAEGAHPGNSERDLHRWLNNLWGFKLQTYTVHIDLHVTGHLKTFPNFCLLKPFKLFNTSEGAQVFKCLTFESNVLTKSQNNSPRCFPRPASWPQVGGKVPRSVPVQILLPHEILHCISECGSSFLFDSVMLGHMDDASRVEFWEHVSKLPPWKDHPALNDNKPWEKLVGMTLHADGAAFHRDDEYFVYSITSVFGSMYGFNKDVLLTKIPLCVIPERQLKGKKVAHLYWHGFTNENNSLCYLSPFLSCLCPSSSEVRADANKIVADVISWSMKISTSGIGPATGFYNEVFQESTYRAKLCGAKLAKGWRPHSYERDHLFKFWGVPSEYLV